jgi:hypothetical protein
VSQNIFRKNVKKFCIGIKKALHLHSLIELKTVMFGGSQGKEKEEKVH